MIDGQNYTITSDNPSYGEVLNAIKNEEAPARIADLFRTANAIKRYLEKSVTGTDLIVVDAENGELFYNGEQIHNVVVDRIVAFMRDGLPAGPLVNFLARLLQNPSKQSIAELYNFLEVNELPITPEGKVLGYKGVREDYLDSFSGKFLNTPGSVIEMPRRQVDDDVRQLCSTGFHVGSLEYATGYGERTVIVEFDPADVVSVPQGQHTWKLRVAKYRVVQDFKGQLPQSYANGALPYEL